MSTIRARIAMAAILWGRAILFEETHRHGLDVWRVPEARSPGVLRQLAQGALAGVLVSVVAFMIMVIVGGVSR